MKYRLIHKTQYKYAGPVSSYHSLACVMPKSLPQQECSNFSLVISPFPDEISQRADYFGNTVHYFSIHKPHTRLTVMAKSLIETRAFTIPEQLITCVEVRELLANNLKNKLLEYVLPSPFVYWDDDIRNYARDCFPDGEPLYRCARRLCHKIFAEFTYVPDFTTIYTPLKTVLKEKKGVCQDFSHLAIACFRSLGFAARYVSGYLETQPPPGKPKLQGSDATHAWVSVYVPGMGWCDFDPTNDVVPQERHIVTAWGRDYGDVPPLKGILFSSGGHEFHVAVDVLPVP